MLNLPIKSPNSVAEILRGGDIAGISGGIGNMRSPKEQLLTLDFGNLFGEGKPSSLYEAQRRGTDLLGIQKTEDEINSEGKTQASDTYGQQLYADPGTYQTTSIPTQAQNPRMINFNVSGNPFAQRAQQMGLKDYQRAQAQMLRGYM